MKNLTGFPVTIQSVSTQTTKQMRLGWSPGTSKVFSLSKCVGLPLPFSSYSYLLVLQVYKAIFTSPSSAKYVSEDDDDENMPPAKLRKISSSNKPVRRNVATKLHLNGKVTPRSIAYAAVQVCLFYYMASSPLLICDCKLHFNLQTAGSWSAICGGFDYEGLYNYIVDVFEDTPGPAAKKRAQDLLKWWSK